MKNGTVLLAGAGIGGVAAALALLRRGIDVELHEQSPQLGDVGAGIMLTPNAMRVVADLGLAEAVAAVAMEPEVSTYRRYDTGEVIMTAPLRGAMAARYGAPYFHVHRADLHALLVAAVRRLSPGALRTGSTLVGYDAGADGVVARFAGGAEVRGSLLVGCDGVRSAVRELTFGGTTPSFTGQVAWRGLVPAAGLPPSLTEPGSTAWIGQDRHIIHYRLRGGSLVNYVAVVRTAGWQEEGWNRRSEVAEAVAEFRSFHADAVTLLESTDAEHCYKWGLFDRNPLATWTRGRVSLLGDAAHPMLPFMAQGAAMSLEDALVLGRAVAAHGTTAEALLHYERLRLPRTTQVVLDSRAATSLYQRLSGDKQAARARNLDDLYGYDAATVTP